MSAVAQHRDRLAAEQKAEVAHPQGAQERRSGTARRGGDQGISAIRGSHSTLIRTESPSSSWVSTMGPTMSLSTACSIRVE